MLLNGSRKYKLNKQIFEMKQNKRSIEEYYTSLSSVWEEIDALNMFPKVTTVNAEVTSLLDAINSQKAKSKLFQWIE